MQYAILKANKGDLSMITELSEMVKNPFEQSEKFEKYFEKQP